MSVDKDAASDAALVDEIFASDRDRGADSAAPEPSVTPPSEVKAEAPAKVETTPEKVEDGDDGSSKQYRDPETGRFVPLTELKTERAKRQEEARLRSEAEMRAARAEAAVEEARRLWALQQQPQQHFQQQQPEQQSEDFWTDPNRFLASQLQAHEQRIRAEMARERLLERIADSREQMMATHKDYEDLERVFVENAQSSPGLLHAMAQARNPAKFAYESAKRMKFLADVGSEPDGYVQRIREEERKKVLEELKLGPPQTQRFPGTLSDAPAAGAQGRVMSDAAIVDDVFASDRRRRNARS